MDHKPAWYTDSRGSKSNVLIKRNGHACISDFSVPAIISDQESFLSTCIEGGVTLWMSPKLLDLRLKAERHLWSNYEQLYNPRV